MKLGYYIKNFKSKLNMISFELVDKRQVDLKKNNCTGLDGLVCYTNG